MGCNKQCQEHILDIADGMAGGFALLTLIISLIQIIKHLIHYTNPYFQNKIMTIIFMAPFYAITSFCTIVTKDTKGFFALVRDIYEAVLIYAFFHLLALYLAYDPDTKDVDYDRIYEALATKGVKKHVFPMNFLFKPLILISPIRGMWFYRQCWLYILQYLAIRPLMTFFLIIVYIFNEDSPVALVIKIIVFISVLFSVYFLVLFYQILKEELAFTRPLLKFISVKGVLFFTFWQDFAIEIFKPKIIQHFDGLDPEEEKYVIEVCEHLLVCFEMVILAIMLTVAFSHHDFMETERTTSNFRERKNVGHLTKKLLKEVIAENVVAAIEDLKDLKEPFKANFHHFEEESVEEEELMTISQKKEEGLIPKDVYKTFRVSIKERIHIIPDFHDNHKASKLSQEGEDSEALNRSTHDDLIIITRITNYVKGSIHSENFASMNKLLNLIKRPL